MLSLCECEAECIASSFAAFQAFCLESMLIEMKIIVTKPLQLMVEKKSAQRIPVSHGRSKHIKMQTGQLKQMYCPIEVQTSDILIKALKLDQI